MPGISARVWWIGAAAAGVLLACASVGVDGTPGRIILGGAGVLLGVGACGLVVSSRAADEAVVATGSGVAAASGEGDGRDDLRAVLDAVQSPVMATTRSGRVVLCNEAADRFFAGRPGPVVGRGVEDLFTQADVLGVHAASLRGEAAEARVRMAGPEGPRVLQVVSTPTAREGDSPGGIAAVLSLRDITELAMAVQLKTDFVANASHELRTPLSSIRGAIETLADGAWDDAPMRDRLARMIAGNVNRLEELVRDLLDLSRLESTETEVLRRPVRFSQISAAVREQLERAACERRLTLVFEVAPELERMRTDPGLLELIVKNLVENATKFAYEGTEIRIVGEVAAGGTGARIRVIDRGIGIPLEQQQRVFERFYQVDPSRAGNAQRRGTGLGLAIVKHAVKALGGAVTVVSIWKEGTTMTVELPGAVEESSAT